MENPKQLNIKLNNFRNELISIDEQINSLKQRRLEIKDEMQLIEAQLKSISESNSGGDGSNFLQIFPWSEKAQHLLESVFKLKEFRSHQLPAINATLSGYDVLLIMPTGGGKSLCFQLSALISKGLTVVVSPLISLIEDQLNASRELGIHSVFLNSQTPANVASDILKSMASCNEIPFRILYVTPEKVAKSKRFMAQLEKCHQNGQFKRLVIDEVHCCSQWGHDFRPDYKFLGIMRNQFPETPILGLTATATPAVILDIQKILNIKGCYVFKDSFYRPNLRYFVERIDGKDDLCEKIAKLLKGRYSNQSGLIYCLTIKEVEDLTDKLRKLNIKALAYHASLSPSQRTSAYQKWFQNQAQVIVATVAFGMGINKNNVRFVLHYSISKSFENYYQESGRSGRDGLPADCILYFKFSDIFRATTLVFSEKNGLKNLYAMVLYCINRSVCRKEQISNYFGDEWNEECNGCCDNCINQIPHESIDLSQDMATIQKIILHATSKKKRLTALKLLDIWLGKGEKELRPNNLKAAPYSREKAQDILAFLLVNNYLKEEFHFTPYSTISYINIGSSGMINLSSSKSRIEFLSYIEEKGKSKKTKNQEAGPTTKTKKIKATTNNNGYGNKNDTNNLIF